jgi:ribonuclease HI
MKVAYTDGGCDYNPGLGGWAFYVQNEVKAYGFGGEYTTNQLMELKAMTECLKYIGYNTKAQIHTDSTYVQKGLTEWQYGWRKHNWIKGDGNPVANSDEWRELVKLYNPDMHEIIWVKGHSGVQGNEICDELVQLAKEEKVEKKLIEDPLKSSSKTADEFLESIDEIISDYDQLTEYDKRLISSKLTSKLAIFNHKII